MAIRVVNLKAGAGKYGPRDYECLIHCGRGTPLGNRHSCPTNGRIENIKCFKADFEKDIQAQGPMYDMLLDIVEEAKKGDVALGCYCAPLPCHLDVVKEKADTLC